MDFFNWITDLSNSKQVALLLFFAVFVGIVIYVYTGKRRGQRLESYKYIPFEDEDADERSRRRDSER